MSLYTREEKDAVESLLWHYQNGEFLTAEAADILLGALGESSLQTRLALLKDATASAICQETRSNRTC